MYSNFQSKKWIFSLFNLVILTKKLSSDKIVEREKTITYISNYLCNASSWNILDRFHQYTVMVSHWYEFPMNNHFDRLFSGQTTIFLKLLNFKMIILTPVIGHFIWKLSYLDMGQIPVLSVYPFLQKHPILLSEFWKF